MPPQNDNWNGTGSWTANLTDWSLGAAPSSTNPTEIQTGTDTLTAAGTTAALQVDAGAQLQLNTGGVLTTSGTATVAGNFYLQNGALVTTTGGLTITGGGRVLLDPGVYIGGNGGSTLAIGGTLTNNSTDGNALYIGSSSISAADTVTAKALNNTGVINIVGNTSVLSTLDITTGAAGFGTAGVETGNVYLQGDALLEFASGQITTVNGQLDLNGPSAFVADAGSLTKNSALAGLATVAGNFYLQNGAVVSTTGGLSITGGGRVLVDPGVYIGGSGGSTLTINGTLTNSSTDGNALDIGNSSIGAADTVTAKALSNTGVINIVGNTSVLSTLDITTGAAGFGTAAVETGSVYLQGDALLEFASGQITTVNGQLDLNGPSAFVADAGSLTKNSALAGLATVAGYFYLQNGAVVSTTGGLTITGGGRVLLDPGVYIGGSGGSTLTINGTLTNTSTDGNALYIGNSSIGAADTVTAKALSSTGEINIVGAGSVQATLDITTGAAGFGTVAVETGGVYLQGDALLEFASGQVTTINGQLQINGSDAFVADAGSLTKNSALAGLATVAGNFYLQNGAVVSTTGGLTITGGGRVLLDSSPFIGGGGGSTLTINGTLTNTSTDGNALYIGNSSIGAADTVTAKALSNTGDISIVGSGNVLSTLDITTGAAGFGTAAVETGSVYLQGDSLLEFASGQITTVNGQLYLNGPSAFVADAGSLTKNSALAGLATVAGNFYLQNGAVVSTTGGLTITGGSRVLLDSSPFIGGGGGSTLTINGTLTNTSTDGNALYIGNGGIGAADTVTAKALSNTGVIAIQGSGSVQATLDITTGTAGFGTAAVQTGAVYLSGDALLEFASGQITTVDGLLQLSGSGAFVADAGSLTTNSALTGLATVAGDFYLQNGAMVSTTGGLAITGGGRVLLDSSPFIGGGGGSTLTINGTLTNSSTDGNALYIGNGGIGAADTVTATALSNTGVIAIQGSGSVQATLDITTGTAGFGTAAVQTGAVYLSGDALLEFASGQITTVAGLLQLSGSGAFVADAGSLTTNSALTGLATVAGDFYLQNGAVVSTTGGLTITGGGRVLLDSSPYIGGGGGSTLTINGTLTNTSTDNNALYIGGSSITAADTLTAAGLNNAGAITVQGNGTTLGALDVNGLALNTGGISIDASGEIVMGAGDAYNQAGGYTTINTGGSLVGGTIDVTGGYLDGTGNVVGTVYDTGGAVVGGSSFGNNLGTLTVDGTYNQSGAGALEANIANGGGSSGVVAVAAGYYVNLSGGTLLVSSTPQVGVLMTVMTFQAGTLIGQFAHVQDGSAIGDGSNVNLGDGTTLEVLYNNDYGTIQIERVENSTLATTYEWTDGTDNWSNASDWSGGVVPGPTADVVIGSTSTGNVTLNGSSGDTTVDSVSILASNALTIAGITLTAAAGASGISVASGGSLTLVGNGEIDGSVLSGAGVLQTASGNGGYLAGDTVSAGTTFTSQLNATTVLLGAIDNIGTIDVLGGNGTNSSLTIGNAVTLTGGGVVTLDTESGGGSVYVQGNNNSLTNAANTIQGTGIFGNGSLTLINQAVVDATPEGGTSTLVLNGSGVTNTGTLEATAGGVLQINTTVDNAGGTVSVDGTSTVQVFNGTIQGGTLAAAAAGTLETNGTATLDGTTQGALTITTGSTYTASNNATTILYGSIVNHGTLFQIGGNGANSSLTIGNAVTLTGGGVVTLDTQAGGGQAYVQGNNQTLTNVNNTIQGTGILGNGSLVLTNASVVDATPEGGTSTLVLNGSSGVTNTGTLEATAGGLLQINTTLDNLGGTVSVDATSTVEVYNATIQGGSLVNSTGGTLETIGSSALDGTTQGALTISTGSVYTASNNTTTTLYGSIVNDGTLLLNGGNGANGFLSIGNAVTLTGGGVVTLSTQPGGGEAYLQGNNQTLTNVNNTIQGTGYIGNGNLVLVNDAIVDATPEGGSAGLVLNGGVVTNTGTLEATAGGVLTIETNVTNTGANITASGTATGGGGGGGGSSVVNIVNGATITGGTLSTVNTGMVETSFGNSAAIQGVTIASGSSYTVANASQLLLLGVIDNAGLISLAGGNGSNGYLSIGNTVTLTGGGTVTLSTQSGGGEAFLQGNNQTLTNTNNTIQGTGVIGNGNLLLVNNSVIDATPESNTNALTLNGGGVTNTDLLEAKAGGVLVINTTIDNLGGTVLVADSTSTVELYSASVQGGTLSNSAGGTLETAGGSATLDGTTQGTLTLSAGSVYTGNNSNSTYLDGSIVNKGTIVQYGGNGANGSLNIGNAVTLSGGGTITLNTQSGGGEAFLQGNNQTLTNTNNTIQGTGVIGNGNLLVVNNSVIDATPENNTSALTLNGGVVTNTDLLEAKAGGVLVLNTTIDNFGGTVLVADSTSTVELYNASVQGGTLSNSAGGALETANGSATLDGTTQGALTLSAGSVYTSNNGNSTYLYGSIVNKGTIVQYGGNGNNGALNISNAVTLTGGGTVTLSTQSGGGEAFLQGNNQTLTNTNNTIQGTGVIGNGNLVLVNSGVVDATPEGNTTTLTLNGGGVTNTGTLEATGGGTLSLTSGTITNNGTVEAQDASAVTYSPGAANANNSSGVLTGGTWAAYSTGDGATLSITGGAVTTDAATIILSGAGSVFQAGDGNTFTTLENSLTTINAGGTLEILGSRVYTTTLTITDSGLLQLGGGTFSAPSLTVASGGLVSGYGTVATPVANSGTIVANGGTLDVTGAESGTGALEAVAASVLLLAANSPITSDSVYISLTGAGSEIEFGTGTPTKIESSLTTIASGGTLAVLGSRGYSTSLGITDSGVLQLAGGTLAPASLSVTSGGKLLGYGTVTPAVANAGTIEANGGLLDLSAGASGAGTLIADVGATLELAGTSTTTTAGAVIANGTVDLAGGTLTASSITVASGGELTGYGTVTGSVANSGSVVLSGGVLYLKGGVTGTGALVDTRGNLLLYDANSAGAVTVNGLVDLLGATLTATSVTIGSAGDLTGYGTVTAAVSNSGEIVAGGASTLKIAGAISGSGSLSTGGSTLELAGTTTAGTVTDAGTLKLDGISLTASSVTVTAKALLIGTGTIAAPVANSGTIEATAGTLAVAGAETGTGALEALASSVLQLAGNAPLTTDTVYLLMTGSGSEIEFGSGPPTTIENSLSTIASGGTLAVLGNRNYTTSLALTDSGLLQLGGGTLAAALLSVTAGAKLLAYGTISSAIANSGTIQVNSGQLSLTGGVTGTGALIDTLGNLNLYGANSARSVTVDGGVTVNSATLTATSVAIASTGDLSGSGTIISSISNYGEIVAGQASTLKIVGAVSGNGTLLTSGSTLELAGTTMAGTVTDTATLKLDAITLTATSVTVSSGKLLSGSGTVTAAVANSGTIEATGGTLNLNGAVTGTGTLKSDAGAALEISGATTAGTVTNNGTLEMNGGALTPTSLTVASGALLAGHGTVTSAVTNSGTIEATGGTLDITGAVSSTPFLEALAASVLQLGGNTAPTSDTKYISLTGAGSEIEWGSGTPTTIENSLTTIAAGGTLAVLGSRGYTTSLAIMDSGLLQLGGGTFAPASLSTTSGGKLLGYGTVTPVVANAGTVDANGGVLDLSAGASGAGTLIADAGATLELAGTSTTTTAGAVIANGTVDLVGGTLTASSIAVASGGDLLGYGTVTSAIANSGSVIVNGGQLFLKGGVTGTGALVDAKGDIYLYGTDSAGAVTVNVGIQLYGAALTATSVTVASGGLLFGYGTVTSVVSSSGEIDATGGTLEIVGAVSGAGTLYASGSSTLELAGTTTAGTVTANGTLQLAAITLTATSVTVGVGDHLIGSGTVASSVANSGTIESNTSLLDVTGAVTGTGTLKIDVGQTLEVGSTVASTQTAVFASTTGTLSLDEPLNFAGSITNFTGSDQIYLGGETITGFGGYNTATHVLTVLGTGNATIAQLTFNGSYTLGNFSVSNNGLYILDPPVTAAMTGGSSTPTFINAAAGNQVIAMPVAGAGVDDISGFSLTNGDVLDFTAALKGAAWHGDLTQVGNFVTTVANASDTDLYLDPTGHGHGSMVAALDGVNTTVASLLTHNAIRVT
jgi:HPt (histidine-containing phosphotransfer) domain-containing protein